MTEAGRRRADAGSSVEFSAVERALFSGRFTTIASEMGELLRRMSFSTNIKERLDFSCALLDPEGRLLVNAPHIPVHLGALGLCVRTAVQHLEPGPGDVIITNHPAYGGSHLPDVTVFGPVFHGGAHVGYVASRAHHAEIGGKRPGSMPPDARCLEEEGVVIPAMHLVEAGRPCWDAIESVLTKAPYPSRLVEENLADLRGALAAHRRGESMLRDLAETTGRDLLLAQMNEIHRASARRMEQALETHDGLCRTARARLDDGTLIQVAIDVRDGRATVDFDGSSPVTGSNFNATRAIVTSAVLYCLRLLIGEELPLNEGLLVPVDLRIPGDSFLNPRFEADPRRCPAVAAGNTETSQRVVDALLEALGLCSGGQGTMNNLLYGNDRFGTYETIGGGAGAGPGFPGADGVHTHMTNTRITDAEVLESRYPVRLREFSIRRGSGGAGRWPGGDGLVRELEFLEDVEVSFLGQHRRELPFALERGEPGEVGRQWIRRRNGRLEAVGGVSASTLRAGECFRVETPSGAGYGAALVRPSDEA